MPKLTKSALKLVATFLTIILLASCAGAPKAPAFTIYQLNTPENIANQFYRPPGNDEQFDFVRTVRLNTLDKHFCFSPREYQKARNYANELRDYVEGQRKSNSIKSINDSGYILHLSPVDMLNSINDRP